MKLDDGSEELKSDINKFNFINKEVRKINEDYIHNITTKVIEDKYADFEIKAFKPLKSSAIVGDFGENREFYYLDKLESSSRHLGIDIASTKHSEIFVNNAGIVVDKKYNGIYGDMPTVYFGLGLYGIYGHCSEIKSRKGFSLESDEVIGRTGTSGLVIGDHVHFGTLVQGIEVRPNEWMSQGWIDNNINSVINEAKLKLQI